MVLLLDFHPMVLVFDWIDELHPVDLVPEFVVYKMVTFIQWWLSCC